MYARASMVILAPDQPSAEGIERVAGGRLGAKTVVVGATLSAAQAVASARAKYGGEPLAYVAANDAQALEAIGAGADEAMPLPTLDPHGILLLLDRTAQRASLRRAEENERTSVIQSEKLAALGTIVAGVAHEINNPLAAVLLSTEVLKNLLGPLFDAVAEVNRLAAQRRSISAEEIARIAAIAPKGTHAVEGKEVLDELTGLAEMIASVVKDLRIYARSDENEVPQIVNVTDLIEQVLRIVGREITTRGHIERDYGSNLPPVVVPRSRIVQVLTNILVNATHAIQEVQRPMHRVRITVRVDPEAIAISISDTGPGIAPEAIERIFDPFYTTKREGSGTGLGLSISRAILRRIGGDLVVESVHGVGATFIALIPLPDRASLHEAFRRSAPSSRRERVAQRRAAVLVVDDDARLLRVYPRILHERFEVLVASDGQEAIDLLASGSQVDVVLTDMAMPELDGMQLYEWLSVERPELARHTLFVTASVGDARFGEFLARAGDRVLEKPVSRDALFHAIDEILKT
jgi:signal transduction histidine kinase/CheY-like chemotaxis protein